jgi:hypothetical protein
VLDQRQLADPRVGLAQLDTDMRGKAYQAINAMPMPISSSAPTEACAGSRPIWAASSATSGDASMAIPSSKKSSPGR